MFRVILFSILFSGSVSTLVSGRKNADDGKGILVSDLLTNSPFRIVQLREIKQKENNDDDSASGSPCAAFALEANTLNPKLFSSQLYANPTQLLAKKSNANNKNFTLDAVIGRYDNMPVLKAMRIPKELMKPEVLLRKTRYMQTRDTQLTVTLFREEGGGGDGEKNAEARRAPLLSLTTLNPYLSPLTNSLLGGRVGALTQAVRFEATGRAELEGLMAADGAFWAELVGAEPSVTADGDSVYGTFTLSFLNRQEFVLRLKPIVAAAANASPSSNPNNLSSIVTFYGVTTGPVTPSAQSVASALANIVVNGRREGYPTTGAEVLATLFGTSDETMRNTLRSASSSSSSNLIIPPVAPLSLIDSVFFAFVKGLALPFRLLAPTTTITPTTATTTAGGEDNVKEAARTYAASVASIIDSLVASWPLLLASFGVLTAKVVADIVNAAKDKRVAKEISERERAKREANIRLAQLLGTTPAKVASTMPKPKPQKQ